MFKRIKDMFFPRQSDMDSSLSTEPAAQRSVFSSSPSHAVSTKNADKLAPPIKYHSMSVIGSSDDYTDDLFFKDLETLEKPYEIPQEYEEV